MSLLKNILLVIISPTVGWEEIDKCGYATSRVLKGAFIPLLVILALSAFVRIVYDPVEHTVILQLIEAIISVAMYLFTYFFTSYLLTGFYPELARTKVALAKLNNYIIYNLIILVLLQILTNLLPGPFAPLMFLTAYAAYTAHRGTPFLGLKREKQNKFTIIAACLIILMPWIIWWLLHKIIV